MGTSSLENQDRLGRESAVAPEPEWLLGLGAEKESGLRGSLSTSFAPKLQFVFSLVKHCVYFYVVYFDWAEPSLP